MAWRGPLRLRLSILPAPGEDGVGPSLRLDLVNVSEAPVSVWYVCWTHYLRHVHFLVRRRDSGAVAGAYCHGDVSSTGIIGGDPDTGRLAQPFKTLTLQPGETCSRQLLLQTVQHNCGPGPVAAGPYRLEAVFYYRGELGGLPAPRQDYLARSQSLIFEVAPWCPRPPG